MQTSSTLGGVETWLDRTCSYLATRGFEPVVGLARGLANNNPARYRQQHPDLDTIEVDGRGLNRDGRVRALMRGIRKVRPAIVLPLGVVDANAAVVRCKLDGDDVRLLAHAQGNLPPMLADLRLYRDWFDRVVCPGRLTRRMLVEWGGFAPERVEHIPNGADAPIVERLPRRNDGVLRLGYVGRLSQPDKRVLDLVPLCHELIRLRVPFELDVAGDGPARTELAAGLAEFGSRVRMLGPKDQQTLYREIFPTLDVLMMTSASEAFGIVLVEAMMHGVVPVSSRYHGFHSEGLVLEGETGLAFEVGDMAGAARAVQDLHAKPDRLQALAARARLHGAGYTWERSLSQWEASLRTVAEEPVLHATTHPIAMSAGESGRLERLGVSTGMVDRLRRLRRAVLGPAVPAGGEEWPLFHRFHKAEQLAAIREELLRIDGLAERAVPEAAG
ncbi:hypothetical protein GCM10010080_19390 [Thermomonas carbonis]|nr:hypothetical protein GCM10010080_19390 [Thermomonas carbonis]